MTYCSVILLFAVAANSWCSFGEESDKNHNAALCEGGLNDESVLRATEEVFEVNDPKMQFVLAPVSEYMDKKLLLEKEFARDLPSQEEARTHYKKNKKEHAKTQTGKKFSVWSPTTISDMDFDQLMERKAELIIAGDYTMATKYLERIFKLAQTPEQLMYIMLEWAELLMHTGSYKKAELLLRDFIRLYPGNEYVEIAFLKAIECSWYQTLTFDRDQSKTEDTLQLIAEFCSRTTGCSELHKERVMTIKDKCENKIAQSILSIAKHDVLGRKYREVHKRLDDLRTTMLVTLPHIEPEILQVEIQLARAEDQKDVEQQKLQELQEKFPGHDVTLALMKPKKLWFLGA